MRQDVQEKKEVISGFVCVKTDALLQQKGSTNICLT